MSPLKVAFIGGAIDSAVGRAHRTAIELDKKFSLVAGCFSLSYDMSLATADDYGLDRKRVYKTTEEMLAEEADSIDALVVLTPQHVHFSNIMTCLDQNVRVICEKALVSSVEEAMQIRSRISEKNGFLRVISNYTGFPMVRELKSMIAAGGLGEIRQINVEMPQEGFARTGKDGQPIVPQSWRLVDQEIPTVSLDLGVHLHMLIRFLTGKKPLDVVGMTSTLGNFPGIKDSVASIVRYEGDTVCSIWYSKAALGYRNGLKVRIFGSEASAEWVEENPELLVFADKFGNRYELDRASPSIEIANQTRYSRFKAGHPAGFIEAFANYYWDVHDDVRNAAETNENSPVGTYCFGIDASIEGLNLLAAIQRSADSRKWEPV